MIAEIIDALSLLTPCEVDSVKKVRIGSRLGDGGYVLADRFRPGQKAYSYGISSEVSFDHDLAKRELEVFMYDHTIASLPFDHPKFNFFQEGIGSKNDREAAIFTLEYHVKRNGHDDEKDMILKIDVEGAEWEILNSTGPTIVDHFEQVAMEIHDLHKLGEPPFRERFVQIFSKLTRFFNIIHVHANNSAPIVSVSGLMVPGLLEVTLLRKDVGQASAWSTFIPSDLDVPNVSWDDHVLAFYPFLPMTLPPDEFKAGLTETFQRATMSPHRRHALLSADIPRRGINIGKEGVCTQSSLSQWSVAPDEANRALRTVKTGSYAFHTDIEDSPWWQVDLGSPRLFDEIIVYNRLDKCSERSIKIISELSTDAKRWKVVHKNEDIFGGVDGNPLRIICQHARARYVRLRVPMQTALHLDAVEIYAWG